MEHIFCESANKLQINNTLYAVIQDNRCAYLTSMKHSFTVRWSLDESTRKKYFDNTTYPTIDMSESIMLLMSSLYGNTQSTNLRSPKSY